MMDQLKIIPLLKVRDMRAALRHYTEVLDFRMTWPEDTPDSAVVDLGYEEMAFQITTHESERLFGSVIYMYVSDVDGLFANTKAAAWIAINPILLWSRARLIRPRADGNFM